MAKDNFDDYKARKAQSQRAKDALQRKLFPEVFVEKELKVRDDFEHLLKKPNR